MAAGPPAAPPPGPSEGPAPAPAEADASPGTETTADPPEGPTPAPPGSEALRVEGLEKHFGPVAALTGVSFTIGAGEFVTLLGPSGCGKSTILRIVAGIEEPTRGAVTAGGEVVNDTSSGVMTPPDKRDLSMVFQSYAVWPHMTVAANVAFPLRYRKVPRRQRAAMVADALRAVRMDGFADRYPHQLSGGQQQRVAIARSIVARPGLLLLDEPLSNLDARLREDMRIELKRLQLELGLTMLYVTHDQAEALAMSDRILVMDHGRVLQEGTPEEVYRGPESLAAARFLGVKNTFGGTLAGPETVEVLGRRLPVRVVGRAAAGDAVTVAIRPDGFVRAPRAGAADAIDGQIRLTEFLGQAYDHEIDVDGATLIVRTAERLGDRGDAVALGLAPQAAVAFAEPPEDEPGR